MSDDKFSITKGDELGEQDHNKVFTDKYIKPFKLAFKLAQFFSKIVKYDV